MKKLIKRSFPFLFVGLVFFFIGKPVFGQRNCIQRSPPCPLSRPTVCTTASGVDYCCINSGDCNLPPSGGGGTTQGSIGNPLLPSNLTNLSGPAFLSKGVSIAVSLGLIIGVLIFLFILIAGGISWISSGNDKNKLEGAQKQITHALMGLALLFLIFVIIKLIEYIFGISITSINIPTF